MLLKSFVNIVCLANVESVGRCAKDVYETGHQYIVCSSFDSSFDMLTTRSRPSILFIRAMAGSA